MNLFLGTLGLTVLAAGVTLIILNVVRPCVNFEESMQMYQTNTNISDLIVSFTTLPDRLQSDNFKQVIAHMCHQSLRPKEIHIYIPYKAKRSQKDYEIPTWLDNTPVIVKRCEDIGPATKFWYALKHAESPKQRFIICDDEYRQPYNWIESYAEALKDVDENTALTSQGAIVNSQQLMWTYVDSTSRHMKKPKIRYVHILQGFATFCVSPEMVDVDRLKTEIEASEESFYNDDIVMSNHLLQRKVQIAVHSALTRETSLDWFWGHDQESLSKSPKQLKRVYNLVNQVNKTWPVLK